MGCSTSEEMEWSGGETQKVNCCVVGFPCGFSENQIFPRKIALGELPSFFPKLPGSHVPELRPFFGDGSSTKTILLHYEGLPQKERTAAVGNLKTRLPYIPTHQRGRATARRLVLSSSRTGTFSTASIPPIFSLFWENYCLHTVRPLRSDPSPLLQVPYSCGGKLHS